MNSIGKAILVHYGCGVQMRGDVKVVENCTRSPMFLSLMELTGLGLMRIVMIRQ